MSCLSYAMLLSVIMALFGVMDGARAGEIACTVDGIHYDGDGRPQGCVGGGSWCMGTPVQPGICERTTNRTVPPRVVGSWEAISGTCDGASFDVQSGEIEYRTALELLGAGKIVGVQEKNNGLVTIETILVGEGRFLSLWPSRSPYEFFFGYGSSAGASAVEKCRVVRADSSRPAERQTSDITMPRSLVGQWIGAWGTCRGMSFQVDADRIVYQVALEPLGRGRIIGALESGEGIVTIETVLAGEGRFLSLWPAETDGVVAFGIGETSEASMVERCQVTR
jgi:hypothetical protein